MKKINLIIFTFSALAIISKVNAQDIITFQVDLSEEESVSEVGIRGNLEPPSWEVSQILTDRDGNGIYSVVIEFPSANLGDTLEFKFLRGKTWERQNVGNRKIVFTGKPQVLPASNWHILDDKLFSIQNPLENYIGIWEVISNELNIDSKSTPLYYGKGKKMEGGRGVHFIIYMTYDGNLRDPVETINWTYHKESNKVYAYATGLWGLFKEEGTIDAKGNLFLKAWKVGDENEPNQYRTYEWTFESKDKIKFVSTKYADDTILEKEERYVIRMSPEE